MRTVLRYVFIATSLIGGSLLVIRWITLEQKKTNFVEDEVVKKPTGLHGETVKFIPGTSRKRNVFYNRVGKCGSRSILQLASRMSKMYNYTFLQSRDFEHDRPPHDEMVKEIKKIAQLRPPTFYNRHIHYLDFKKYGYPQPIYINVVRDPIERFSSQYNYAKYGDGEGPVKHPNTDWPDINVCVMQNVGICNTSFMFYTGLYFCGFDEICETPAKGRVDLAKKHIDEDYVLIGILEEFENTLLLLQRMLPEYFLGAVNDWKKHSGSRTVTITKRKEFLTREAIDKLKNQDMKEEYEVYNHARRKFEALKKKYGIYTKER